MMVCSNSSGSDMSVGASSLGRFSWCSAAASMPMAFMQMQGVDVGEQQVRAGRIKEQKEEEREEEHVATYTNTKEKWQTAQDKGKMAISSNRAEASKKWFYHFAIFVVVVWQNHWTNQVKQKKRGTLLASSGTFFVLPSAPLASCCICSYDNSTKIGKSNLCFPF